MQTILGASGQIGRELALELRRQISEDLRLVSRAPRKVNADDQLLAADLLDREQTRRAVAGSDTVYLTAGLPMDTRRWVAQWPLLMHNVIEACAAENARLVFFDNTYMYPQTAVPQTENTAFAPHGAKGRVRAEIAEALLDAMARQRVQAMICRAPEFYGPGLTLSITNATILDRLKSSQTPKVFLRDDTLRSLIYTPDASRAMALLGNTAQAYGQTWHLPCDDNRLTYRQFIELAAQLFGVAPRYQVLKHWQLRLAGLFNQTLRDAAELLPRYTVDNLFVSDKFKQHFPNFRTTSLRDGLEAIHAEHVSAGRPSD